VEDAKEVLKSLTPIDREVSAMNGRFYTLRIAPYRTTENSIKGLVITIIDSLEGGRG
jgi:two-component system CheB/CheR fusion protein